jgi:hypothetical protein
MIVLELFLTYVPEAAESAPPEGILILTVEPGVSDTPVAFRYSPPPPPAPELVDDVLFAPLPPAPIASIVFETLFQSDGTVQVPAPVVVMTTVVDASASGAPTNPIAKMREKIMIGEIIFFILFIILNYYIDCIINNF